MADLTNTPALGSILWIVTPSVFFISAYKILSSFAERREGFQKLARTKVSQAATMVIVQVLLGLSGLKVQGLVIGEVVGRSFGTAELKKLFSKTDKKYFRAVSFSDLVNVASKYRRFPFFLLPSAALSSMALYLPALVFLTLYGPELAGFIAVSEKLVGSPMSLIGRSMAHVYTGTVARLQKESPEKMIGLYVATVLRLFFFGVVTIGSIILLAPFLFKTIFGNEWGNTSIYVQIMGIMFMTRMISTPLAYTLNILHRQDVRLLWDLGRFVLVVAGFYFAHYFDLDPVSAVVVYTGTMSLMQLILVFVCYSLLSRYCKKTLRVKQHLFNRVLQSGQ